MSANPANLTAYMALGNIYQVTKQYQQAIEVYSRALEQNPNSALICNNLAFLLAEFSDAKRDLEKALDLATKAQKLYPGDPNVTDTLGWVHYKMGDYERSMTFIEQSLAKSQESAIINYHMGMVLYRLGRPDEAKEVLEKALGSKESFIGKDEAMETLKKLS